jgi:hypothetical protein
MNLLQGWAVFSLLCCVSALIEGQRIVPVDRTSSVVKMNVHRKHTNATDPGASRRQIDIGLANPFYGLSYYVTCRSTYS